MLRTTNRFIRQALFSIFKVAFLVLAIKTPSVLAILLSWVGGMLASWIGLNIVSKGDARRILAHPDFRLLYGLRGKAGFITVSISPCRPLASVCLTSFCCSPLLRSMPPFRQCGW